MIPALLLGPLTRYAVAAAVGALLAGWLVGDIQGARYSGRIATAQAALAAEQVSHAADLKAVSDAAAAATLANQLLQQRMQAEIAAAESQHQEELQHASAQLERLRADLRSGARSLRVRPAAPGRRRSVPGAAGTACVGDAAAAGPELRGQDADALLGIAGSADEIATRLKALQDYARAVSKGGR